MFNQHSDRMTNLEHRLCSVHAPFDSQTHEFDRYPVAFVQRQNGEHRYLTRLQP